MINTSFIQHAASLLPPLGYRLDTPTQLADEIQKGGLTAVGFLEEPLPSNPLISTQKIIATATAKPWIEEWPWEDEVKGKVRRKIMKFDGADGKGEKEVLEWEMTAVVNRYEERYLGKGYASRVMEVLERDLMGRLGDLDEDDGGEVRGKRVWMIRNAEPLTGDYWLSQGFKTVGGIWFEKGTLGCYRRFRLDHMVREFGVGNGRRV